MEKRKDSDEDILMTTNNIVKHAVKFSKKKNKVK